MKSTLYASANEIGRIWHVTVAVQFMVLNITNDSFKIRDNRFNIGRTSSLEGKRPTDHNYNITTK